MSAEKTRRYGYIPSLEVGFYLKDQVLDIADALFERCAFECIELVGVEAFAGQGLKHGGELEDLTVEGEDFRRKGLWFFEVVPERHFAQVFRRGKSGFTGADLDVALLGSGAPATDLAGFFVFDVGMHGRKI